MIMRNTSIVAAIAALLLLAEASNAFVVLRSPHHQGGSVIVGPQTILAQRSRDVFSTSALFATEETKAAQLVSGDELEMMLQEWEQPLVIDAYATWCGPCLLMAPEFEQAAQELKGKVRFVKLDTDKDETMAARLNINGLPTLLFLDKYVPPQDEEETGKAAGAQAVLKARIEGAIQKQNILDLCEHYFFDGPAPVIPGLPGL